MRKLYAAMALVPFLAVAAMAQTTPDYKGYISKTKHNFETKGWAKNEICLPCHTAHNAKPESVSRRLWNHELTTATYTVAGGGTEKADVDMDRTSRLCLSCHDGTVALDSFGGTMKNADPSQGPANLIEPYANLGTDLSNDHPVGLNAVMHDVEYTTRYNPINYTNGRVYNPKYPTLYVSLVDSGKTRTFTPAGGVETTYKNYVVGCYTCHNAHGSSVGTDNLLRVDNQGSKLCLTCHIK